MGDIYYLIPDVHKPDLNIIKLFKYIRNRKLLEYLKNKVFVKHNKPVGGIKVIYQHCIILKKLGYNVYPVLMGSYTGNFFGYNLDFKSINDVGYNLNQGDIIVCPEYVFYQGLKFTGCTKILLNQSQSWRYIDDRLKEKDSGRNYIELGYDYVLNCSEYLREMLKIKMNLDSYVITNGIDQVKFFPAPEKRIKNRVLALSRKHPDDIKKIKARLKGYNFNFYTVDDLTENELIEEYQKADIFISTGYPEGFSLPPLEAMSCGCVVVGYTGGGGDEYMVENTTALVAQDGNVDEVVSKLKLLINDFQLKEFIRAGGIEKSKEYSLLNTEKMVQFSINRSM